MTHLCLCSVLLLLSSSHYYASVLSLCCSVSLTFLSPPCVSVSALLVLYLDRLFLFSLSTDCYLRHLVSQHGIFAGNAPLKMEMTMNLCMKTLATSIISDQYRPDRTFHGIDLHSLSLSLLTLWCSPHFARYYHHSPRCYRLHHAAPRFPPQVQVW